MSRSQYIWSIWAYFYCTGMVFFGFRKAPKIRKLQSDPCEIRLFDECWSGRRNVFPYCFGPPVAHGVPFATGQTTHLVYSGFRLCRLYLKQRAVFFRCREATKTRKLQFDLYECLLSYPRRTASVEISETFIKSHLLLIKLIIWYISVFTCVAYF